MKTTFLLIVILIVIFACSKEETPTPPVITDQACMICNDTVTGEQIPEMCDDTLTIRVWMEYYEYRNLYQGEHWVCQKQKK